MAPKPGESFCPPCCTVRRLESVGFKVPCPLACTRSAVAGKHATPVSVDESLVTLQDAARIARDGLAEIFGIKLNRVGGLTKAARMRDIALAHGIDMFVMATGGSVLADTEALHLAATIPASHRTRPTEITDTRRDSQIPSAPENHQDNLISAQLAARRLHRISKRRLQLAVHRDPSLSSRQANPTAHSSCFQSTGGEGQSKQPTPP